MQLRKESEHDIFCSNKNLITLENIATYLHVFIDLPNLGDEPNNGLVTGVDEDCVGVFPFTGLLYYDMPCTFPAMYICRKPHSGSYHGYNFKL